MEKQEKQVEAKKPLTKQSVLAQIALCEQTINENLGVIKYCRAILEKTELAD